MRAKEVHNFTRGGDPYKKLGIGHTAVLKTVSSADLEDVSNGEEMMRDLLKDQNEMNDLDYGLVDIDKAVQHMKEVEWAIKPYVEFGRVFSWKQEQEITEYVEREWNERWIYDYSPDTTDHAIAFSDVELPQADEIRRHEL